MVLVVLDLFGELRVNDVPKRMRLRGRGIRENPDVEAPEKIVENIVEETSSQIGNSNKLKQRRVSGLRQDVNDQRNFLEALEKSENLSTLAHGLLNPHCDVRRNYFLVPVSRVPLF